MDTAVNLEPIREEEDDDMDFGAETVRFAMDVSRDELALDERLRAGAQVVSKKSFKVPPRPILELWDEIVETAYLKWLSNDKADPTDWNEDDERRLKNGCSACTSPSHKRSSSKECPFSKNGPLTSLDTIPSGECGE
ncbi:hypothetical protein HDV05_007192 [Chytridiales sp. JEL 0842]|nr:hypothetical protein HDV05_007192 [Chytridiales sp. JEL 0842]